MRPLQAKAKTTKDARTWHNEVFALYGNLCWFGKRVGHPKKRAIDAAHVINRGTKLGPLRFADARLGRPLCRECHDAQGAHEIEFSLKDQREAVAAHNEIAKVKLVMP